MSSDAEEMTRAQPMDAVVLMGGCDKTVPAQLMGAVSAGKPSIMLVGGAVVTRRHAAGNAGGRPAGPPVMAATGGLPARTAADSGHNTAPARSMMPRFPKSRASSPRPP